MTAMRSASAIASRLIVRDVDHRRAGARVEAREFVFHRGAQVHVEIGERLVEQDQRRLGDEAARERDALPLAAGEQRRAAIAEAAELDQRQRVVDPARALGSCRRRATVRP